MLLSEVQMSDFKGAASMLAALPCARELLGDKGYDADWFPRARHHRMHSVKIRSKNTDRA
jgi:hypothetical protein